MKGAKVIEVQDIQVIVATRGVFAPMKMTVINLVTGVTATDEGYVRWLLYRRLLARVLES